jgi:hypothetical protein
MFIVICIGRAGNIRLHPVMKVQFNHHLIYSPLGGQLSYIKCYIFGRCRRINQVRRKAQNLNVYFANEKAIISVDELETRLW